MSNRVIRGRRKKKTPRMYNSVARLHTRMSLLFLFNSCSIRAATSSTALLYTKCRVSRAITCARETEVEGEPRQLVVRSK